MKIAFVTTNLAGGGAEKALLNLARLLAGRGHSTRVVLLEALIEHAIPPGVAVDCLAPAAARARHGWLGKRLAAWRLKRHLAARGPWDLVVSTLPYADEVLALADVPRVWFRIANTLSAEVRALTAGNPARGARRLRRYRRLYAGRNLIAVSGGVGRDLREQIGVGDATIRVIGNPFDFAAIRAAAGAESERPLTPYLLHVGRFMPQKRHDLLLDAYALACADGLDLPLVLLTADSPALAALIAARGLSDRVRIAGFRTNPYPWIAGAELLVLCSDREGMPNVLIEALICGTRVVSTDCPSGPAEVMQGKLADFLVPCGDAPALAAAMRRALAAAPVAADLERFAAATVAAAYEALATEHH